MTATQLPPPCNLAPRQAPAAATRQVDITPLAPARYKIQFTVTRETYGRLREAQDLLRHRIPNGDVGAIFDRALSLLLQDLHSTRHAATDRPRGPSPGATTGRHIPAAVRRAVWDRDEGRCAFVGQAGRCAERGLLEYHHLVPFADGGPTGVDNLELRCRAHNRYEAERWFGTGEEAYVREAAAAFG